MTQLRLYNPQHELSDVAVLYHDNEDDHIREFQENIRPDEFKLFNATSSSKEALKLASSGNYDVFICDYRLPGESGISLLRKSQKINPDMKLILYTGYTLEKEQITECNELGIKRARKLESQNLRSLISIVINDVRDFGRSFQTASRTKEDILKQTATSALSKQDKQFSVILPVTAEKLTLTPATPKLLREKFLLLAEDLMQEYRNMPNPEDVHIHISSDEVITAADLLMAMENLTIRGVNFISSWIQANIFVKNELDKTDD